MIKQIIDLLQSQDWTNIKSEEIEIAKGKFELPKNVSGAIKKAKRQWQLKK